MSKTSNVDPAAKSAPPSAKLLIAPLPKECARRKQKICRISDSDPVDAPLFHVVYFKERKIATLASYTTPKKTQVQQQQRSEHLSVQTRKRHSEKMHNSGAHII